MNILVSSASRKVPLLAALCGALAETSNGGLHWAADASTLAFRAGVVFPRWAIREALGGTVAPQLGRYRRGLRLVRYPADCFIEP